MKRINNASGWLESTLNKGACVRVTRKCTNGACLYFEDGLLDGECPFSLCASCGVSYGFCSCYK